VTKLLVSILLIAFMGQTFNQGWYYLDYQIRKKEYVKRCVNKARPMLHCNGKCQLMKKMEQQQKKEQGQAPEMKYAGKIEVLSSKSSFLLAFNALTAEYKKRYFISNSGETVEQYIAIFHPPPTVC
jgi:hypothetical protein